MALSRVDRDSLGIDDGFRWELISRSSWLYLHDNRYYRVQFGVTVEGVRMPLWIVDNWHVGYL
jgi:hypothetical protein